MSRSTAGSEKRIAELDRERESEQSALTNAKARFQRLENRTVSSRPADWNSQMVALQVIL